MSTKKPAARISLYPITAAIWKNGTANGEAFFNVTFERSYKDGDDQWQRSGSYGQTDLLLLSKVVDLAHTRICELRSVERQSQATEE